MSAGLRTWALSVLYLVTDYYATTCGHLMVKIKQFKCHNIVT